MAEQLRHAGGTVRSDFAVHGLAYLGVLLTFAGTLGFVLFAYDSVSNQALRAFGPLLMPLVLGLASWNLYRRGSVMVSVALELLSAALLPVILSAAISTFSPPSAFVPLRTAMSLVLMVLFAAAVIRRPASPLKYAVAPMLWTAVWTAALAFRGGAYSPEQVLITAIAILGTVVATRLRPGLPFAAATRVAAAPATGIVYVLSILFALTEAVSPLTILLIGGVAVVLTEVLRANSPRTIARSLLQTLLLLTSLGVVSQAWSPATVGMLGAVGFTGLVLWHDHQHAPVLALTSPLIGIIIGFGLSLTEAWPALIAGGALALAAQVRRLLPVSPPLAGRATHLALTSAAAVFPLGFASGLWRVLPEGRALIVLALVVTLASASTWRWRQDDAFLAWWLPACALAIALATLPARGSVGDPELALAAALSAAAMLVSCPWAVARTWACVAISAWSSVLLFDGLALSAPARQMLWGGAAFAALVLAGTRRSTATQQLALAGHAGTGVALYLSHAGPARLVTLGAWTLGWLWTTVVDELGDSLLMALLGSHTTRLRLAPASLRAVPSLVLTISTPFLVAETADLVGLVAAHRSWTGVAFALTAIGYAAAARFTAVRRPLAGVIATASIVLSIVAVAVATPDLDPTILSVAGSLAVVGLMGGRARRPVMSWFAWIMAEVLALLIADRAGVPPASLHLVLISTGSVLVIGGLVCDEARAGRRRAGEGLRLNWLVPPVSVGALAIPAGLAFSLSDRPGVYGWWAVAVAGLYLLIALQLRAGGITTVTYGLGAFGIASLLPIQPLDHPILLLPFALVLIAASFVTSRRWHRSDPVLGWDLSPLLIAHIVAALALTRTYAVGTVAVTWMAFGALSLLVAVWRRHWAWRVGGTALILVGAASAGPGWLALALGALSATAVVTAVRCAGIQRRGLQWFSVAAAAAAWFEALDWSGQPVAVEVAISALACAAVALLLAVLVRFADLGRDWLWSWGAAATAGLGLAACLAPREIFGDRQAAFAAATALLVYALAMLSVEARLGSPDRGWVSPVALAAAWLEVVDVAPWSAGQQLGFSAILFALIALIVAGCARLGWLRSPRAVPWTALVTLMLSSAAGLATAVLLHGPWVFLVAAALAGFGAACVMVAGPFAWPWAAWPGAVAIAWGWGEALIGTGWSENQAVATNAAVAGSVTLAAAILRRRFGWQSRFAPAVAVGIAALSGSGLALFGLSASAAADYRLAALGMAVGAVALAVASALVARLYWWPSAVVVSAIAIAVSWKTLVVAAGLAAEQAVAVTALWAGTVAALSGSLARAKVLGKEWTVALGSLAAAGLGGAIAAQVGDTGPSHPYTLGIAAGLAVAAGGAAAAAAPRGWPWLRETSALLTVGSGVAVYADLLPGRDLAVALAVGASLLTLLVVLGLWRARPASQWLSPLSIIAAGTSAGALALAVTAIPDRGPLIAALLVVALEAGTVGLILRTTVVLSASPVLACGAWILFASDALHGNPNWMTSAIGLTLLAVVELVRWDRRTGGRLDDLPVLPELLLTLEYVGLAFLVGATLVQTIFESIWYGLLGVSLGIAIVCWAALTRVRRRAEFGAAVVLVALLLMLTVPGARLVPQLAGIGLWGWLAAAGVTLLLLATALEQSRARVVAGIRTLDQLMAGWE